MNKIKTTRVYTASALALRKKKQIKVGAWAFRQNWLDLNSSFAVFENGLQIS